VHAMLHIASQWDIRNPFAWGLTGMKKIFCTVFCLTLLISGMSRADETKDRRWYRDTWCTEHSGQTDVLMEADRMSCDCLTETHAVRVEFGPDWTRAIGFALHYSLQTGKRGGIVLVLDHSKDYRHWIRLNALLQEYKLPIDAWYIDEGDKPLQDQYYPDKKTDGPR